jgi:hypothetical protein
VAPWHAISDGMLRVLPNGLEPSCPAEAGNSPPLYGTPAGQASTNRGPARRVSFSELLGGNPLCNLEEITVLSE